MTFVVRTWTYRMFFQQKLFIGGGCCSPGRRTAFLTATNDLEDKYSIRVILPEKQLSQNYVDCLSRSETEEASLFLVSSRSKKPNSTQLLT